MQNVFFLPEYAFLKIYESLSRAFCETSQGRIGQNFPGKRGKLEATPDTLVLSQVEFLMD